MNVSTRKIIRAALIAALYVTVCLIFAPISYGAVQLRISEALTLLAVFCPEAVVGVTVGCFLANAAASVPVDMIVGTAATLTAGLLTYKLRKHRFRGLAVVPALPPVIVNAFIVGAELTVLYNSPDAPLSVWLANMASVGAGQIISCLLAGAALVYVIERNAALTRMMTE